MRIFIFMGMLGLLSFGSLAEEKLPITLQEVGITPPLGSQLPLQENLVDENGNTVPLGSFFRGRPVAIVMNYYGCPMLCGLLLNGVRDSLLRLVGWLPGQQYDVLSVSFDPKEGPDLAKAKKEAVLASIDREDFRQAVQGSWHFLVGQAGSEKRLADALGFRFKWVEEEKQYAHAAAIFLASPDGKLVRVLLGLDFSQNDLKLAVLEAGRGKVGTFAEKILLFCYSYVPKHNKYAILASRLVSIGGALTVGALVVAFVIWYLRDRRKKIA